MGHLNLDYKFARTYLRSLDRFRPRCPVIFFAVSSLPLTASHDASEPSVDERRHCLSRGTVLADGLLSGLQRCVRL